MTYIKIKQLLVSVWRYSTFVGIYIMYTINHRRTIWVRQVVNDNFHYSFEYHTDECLMNYFIN